MSYIQELISHPYLKIAVQFVLLTYFGTLLGLYLIQDQLIFRRMSYGSPELSATGLPRLREIKIAAPTRFSCRATPDAKGCDQTLPLLAWYAPPERPGLPTILYLHGNGGHIGLRGDIARPFLDAGYGMLMLEYRGYGDNPGKPSVQGLTADAAAAYDFLRHELGDRASIYVYGESLGGAVALQLLSEAKDVKVDGLVLYAPFTRLADVVSNLYWWVPADLLVKHKFDNTRTIGAVHVPVLVMHGANDRFVPTRMGRDIFDAANEPKELFIAPDSGHYSLWRNGGVDKALAFIQRLSAKN